MWSVLNKYSYVINNYYKFQKATDVMMMKNHYNGKQELDEKLTTCTESMVSAHYNV